MSSGPQLSVRPSANATDFDLWIRMATDNKINAKNSWDFALIDYFHDLSLLREGTSINFQKASATLDGCVKIYSSRVDSAASETSRLLTGLASSNPDDKAGGKDSGASSDDEDDDGQNVQVRRNRRTDTVETTLVKSFEDIRAISIDTELSVDPIFKRALADFDEGGSKSMLLNMLNIDKSGRVVFDTTSDPKLTEKSSEETEHSYKDKTEIPSGNMAFLKNILFQGDIEDLSICPMVSALQEIVENGVDKENIFASLANEPDDQDDHNDYNDYNFNEDEEDGEDGVEDNQIPGVISEHSVNITLQRLFDESFLEPDVDDGQYTKETVDIPDYDLLAYFDKTLRPRWSQPNHWKISNFLGKERGEVNKRGPKIKPPKSSVKMIDFLNDEEENEEELFADPAAPPVLPLSHRKSRHTLPEDYKFTAKRLIYLFTKPSMLKTFTKRRQIWTQNHDKDHSVKADENYYSQRYLENEDMERSRRMDDVFREDIEELHQSYDASYFQDGNSFGDFEDDDNIDPMDGGQLHPCANFLLRPTYINFARVAKRVDIKLLKSNLWDRLKDERIFQPKQEINVISETDCVGGEEVTESQPQLPQEDNSVEESVRFSKVVQGLSDKYTKSEREDLSTSFYFICLLHLANENGFSINNNDDYTDLLITN
ncbi:condensin complex subunit 2/barren [Scheffersomyces xylosifermentans]|uniref:condensin complex subunit 2/barren n=1 Tax=Scheffersomyces xylosifermentans TaxID=1304137 RepID=UPI00315CA314